MNQDISALIFLSVKNLIADILQVSNKWSSVSYNYAGYNILLVTTNL